MEGLVGSVWASYVGNQFRVLRVWRDNEITWVAVRQIGGAFDGVEFKWCLESLFCGGFRKS